MQNVNLVKLLSELVSIPSVTGEEFKIAQFVKSWFEEHGIEVKLQEVEKNRFNVIARVGNGEKKLLLSGHLDTVAPVHGWKTDPFELVVKGNKAFGLGALDMKSGVAILMSIISELKINDMGIVCVLTVDEEMHSYGMYRFLEETKERFYGAIFTEPLPGDRIALVTRCFGRYAVDVRIPLKGGHAAFCGVDEISKALERLSSCILQLKEFEKHGKIGKCEYSVSVVKMGSEFLSSPSEILLRINHRTIEGESIESTIREVKKAFSVFNEVEVKPIERPTPFLEPFYFDESTEFVRRCMNVVKDAAASFSVFDGNLTAMYGIPTVNIGPVGGNIHKPNEYVNISSMERVYEILKHILLVL